MNFLSLCFLGALPFLFVFYNHIPVKFRAPLLLIASWGFYLYGSPESFWILLLITLISYVLGLILSTKRSTSILITGIFLVLSFLIVFKYLGLGLTLPIGISFYTFQTISYLIDVYKKNYKAEKSIFKFSLFVSFFPQLVAGPIERPGNLIPQLDSCKKASPLQIKDGLTLLALGYYKKIVIADFFAPLVDMVFDNPQLAKGPSVLFASILFSLQIFADFSGYSDIARGCAKLFGIELSVNFDHPYLATSLRDFDASTDDYPTDIVLESYDDVFDVTLCSIEWGEDRGGEQDFTLVPLLKIGDIAYGNAVLVKASFPGDMSTLYYKLKDRSGTEHCYYITISGADGAMVMGEFS